MNVAIQSSAEALFSLRLSGVPRVEDASQREVLSRDIETLTTRLAARDESAFAEFHKEYFDRLYQFVLVLTQGREEDAQDALQQTFLRVLRYARPFQREEVFWSWLKNIARSVVRDAGRKRRRYWGLLERFSIFLSNGQSDARSQPEQYLGAVLQESLEELTQEDRLLLIGKYVEGATVKELSSQTDLTEKAVESRLLRLRRRLRETLLKKLNLP